MRVVVQRVSKASVTINREVRGIIDQGLVVLVGFEVKDAQDDLLWMANKILNQRIFADEAGKMNKSIIDIDGDVLLISQFTLHAATKRGNRPSFIRAAKPEVAIPLYEKFISLMSLELGKPVETGEFGANMEVSLVNDGPVTIIIDSKRRE